MPIVTTTGGSRPRGKQGSGVLGAALSLLLAAVAVVAAVVAWPHLRPDRPRDAEHGPTSKPRQIAAHVPTEKPPTAKPPPTNETERPRTPPEPVTEQAEDRARRDREARVRVEREQALAREREAERERERERVVEREREAERERAAVAEREAAARRDADGAMLQAAADGVARHLTEAASMLRRHDYAAAAKSLEAAERFAEPDGSLSTRVDRWKLLLDYAKQLDGYVGKAITTANQGREYTVGSRTISIIEIGPQGFVYKEAGAVKRAKKLPRVLERAILASWFDGAPRPANHIFLGVHRLLDDDVDLAKVRKDWQTAAEGEPATAAIMPLLDDPAVGGR